MSMLQQNECLRNIRQSFTCFQKLLIYIPQIEFNVNCHRKTECCSRNPGCSSPLDGLRKFGEDILAAGQADDVGGGDSAVGCNADFCILEVPAEVLKSQMFRAALDVLIMSRPRFRHDRAYHCLNYS